MIILMENTYGNDTTNIRDHHKKITKEYGKIKKLGQRRFEELRAAFEPTSEEILELTNILIKNSYQ